MPLKETMEEFKAWEFDFAAKSLLQKEVNFKEQSVTRGAYPL
jgi:hypothetical protein